jgi:hypothetical protein
MMETASISETSVNFYQTTWRNNPEDSHLYTIKGDETKKGMKEEEKGGNR